MIEQCSTSPISNMLQFQAVDAQLSLWGDVSVGAVTSDVTSEYVI